MFTEDFLEGAQGLALELEPKTFLEEMYHYFLQGHNLKIYSH